MQDKTIERIRKVEYYKSIGLSKKEILNKLCGEFGICVTQSRRIYNLWVTGGVEVAMAITNLSIYKNKTFIGGDDCFFCGSNETEEHHISYNPQRISNLCKSCHSKIHLLMVEYHTQIKEKDERIKTIFSLLKEINSLVLKE